MYSWFQVKYQITKKKKKSKISNAYISMYKRERERERENLVLYHVHLGKKLPFEFYRGLSIKHLIEIIFFKAYYYLFVTHLT